MGPSVRMRGGGGTLALFLLLWWAPRSRAQCQGFETFEKVSGMTARGAAMAPLFAGQSLTAECNVRCRSSLGCIGYVTNYDMGACYRLAPSPGSQLVMAAERTHYFEKICLKAVPCDRAWAFERVPGSQLADFDDRRMGNVSSRSDCLDLCLAERTFPCRSAEYVASSATCRLSKETRRSQPGAFGPAPDVDYLENFCTPEEMSGACDFQEQPNTDAGHVDLERSGGTREQCESLCSAARLFPCRSFSFNAAASLCRLSSDDAFTVESAVLTRARQGFSFFQRGACLNMSLTCTAEAMTVMLRTQQPFSGRIYARDEPAMCQAFGNGQTVTQITMALQRSRCGVIEESTGLYSNVVVVQRHPVLQRKGDRSVKLMCMFEANNRTVDSGMNVVTDNPGDIDLVNSTAPPPNLRLRITDANGTDVSGATLGDPLFLRVQMDRDSVYGIFPRDLIARSGTTQESITLLDSRGCPTDMTIFPGLSRVEGSRDYQGRFEAFKFSTDAVVRFTVNIQFCLRQCPAVSPARSLCRRNIRRHPSSELRSPAPAAAPSSPGIAAAPAPAARQGQQRLGQLRGAAPLSTGGACFSAGPAPAAPDHGPLTTPVPHVRPAHQFGTGRGGGRGTQRTRTLSRSRSSLRQLGRAHHGGGGAGSAAGVHCGHVRHLPVPAARQGHAQPSADRPVPTNAPIQLSEKTSRSLLWSSSNGSLPPNWTKGEKGQQEPLARRVWKCFDRTITRGRLRTDNVARQSHFTKTNALLNDLTEEGTTRATPNSNIPTCHVRMRLNFNAYLTLKYNTTLF